MADLIITNGDSAAELLATAGKEGRIVPWRDVLHEGPLIAGSIESCSQLRAAFLANRFRIDLGDIAADFAARDAIMRTHADFNRIELWFEHDLFDQLQLVQILAFFADVQRSDGIFLVQADDYLGSQRGDTILQYAARSRSIEANDLELAEEVWADLTTPTPEAIARRVEDMDDRLPFLRPALRRFLEELPSPENGLGRTEATALAGLDGSRARPSDLFRATIAAEEAAFMGDMSFFRLIEDLAFAKEPLVSGLREPIISAAHRRDGESEADAKRAGEAILELTPTGTDVLEGRKDYIDLNGIDRWWAGTWLYGTDRWRYDRDQMELVSPRKSGT